MKQLLAAITMVFVASAASAFYNLEVIEGDEETVIIEVQDMPSNVSIITIIYQETGSDDCETIYNNVDEEDIDQLFPTMGTYGCNSAGIMNVDLLAGADFAFHVVNNKIKFEVNGSLVNIGNKVMLENGNQYIITLASSLKKALKKKVKKFQANLFNPSKWPDWSGESQLELSDLYNTFGNPISWKYIEYGEYGLILTPPQWENWPEEGHLEVIGENGWIFYFENDTVYRAETWESGNFEEETTNGYRIYTISSYPTGNTYVLQPNDELESAVLFSEYD